MIEWRLDGKTSEYLQPTSLLCVFFQFYWILWLEELGLGVWQGDPLPPLLFLVHGLWPWMACSSCIPLAGLLGEATRCCQRLHLLNFAFTRSIIPGVIFILKVRAWDNSPPPFSFLLHVPVTSSTHALPAKYFVTLLRSLLLGTVQLRDHAGFQSTEI